MINFTKLSLSLKSTPLPITFAMAKCGLIGSERTLFTTSSNATCLIIKNTKTQFKLETLHYTKDLFFIFQGPNKTLPMQILISLKNTKNPIQVKDLHYTNDRLFIFQGPNKTHINVIIDIIEKHRTPIQDRDRICTKDIIFIDFFENPTNLFVWIERKSRGKLWFVEDLIANLVPWFTNTSCWCKG